MQPYGLGPLLTHQRNAIQMAFRWRPDGGLVVYAQWDDTTIVYARCAQGDTFRLKINVYATVQSVGDWD